MASYGFDLSMYAWLEGQGISGLARQSELPGLLQLKVLLNHRNLPDNA